MHLFRNYVTPLCTVQIDVGTISFQPMMDDGQVVKHEHQQQQLPPP